MFDWDHLLLFTFKKDATHLRSLIIKVFDGPDYASIIVSIKSWANRFTVAIYLTNTLLLPSFVIYYRNRLILELTRWYQHFVPNTWALNTTFHIHITWKVDRNCHKNNLLLLLLWEQNVMPLCPCSCPACAPAILSRIKDFRHSWYYSCLIYTSLGFRCMC